jgi:PPE-repeat protein
VSSNVKSLTSKVSKLDLVAGVLALIAAISLFTYSKIYANPVFAEYALYASGGAALSFLAAWLKPGAIFARALERKMIRKRSPRSL